MICIIPLHLKLWYLDLLKVFIASPLWSTWRARFLVNRVKSSVMLELVLTISSCFIWFRTPGAIFGSKFAELPFISSVRCCFARAPSLCVTAALISDCKLWRDSRTTNSCCYSEVSRSELFPPLISLRLTCILFVGIRYTGTNGLHHLEKLPNVHAARWLQCRQIKTLRARNDTYLRAEQLNG